MKIFNRSLSVLTAVLMLICLLPFNISAENMNVHTAAHKKTYREADAAMQNAGGAVFSAESLPEAAETGEIWDGGAAEGYAGGTGTETDPYLISNGAELAYLAQQVNGGTDYAGKYFKLSNDICLNDTADWENWGHEDENGSITAPANEWNTIGNGDYPFNGNFNGGGYAVSGIYINKPETDLQGLFGDAEFCTIKNLAVTKSYINGGGTVGGIIGYVRQMSVVRGCRNEGTVIGNYSYTGGIAGSCYDSALTSCINSGSISAANAGAHYIGGIAGDNWEADVIGCLNTGTVSGSYAGGIVGTIEGDCDYDTRANVSDCRNEGAVIGGDNVGGITGDSNYICHIFNCCNTGTVTGNEGVGGLLGLNRESVIYNCYNTGAVSGVRNVGGAVGENWEDSDVRRCYNIGAVSGTEAANAVIGVNNGSNGFCYYLDTCCSGGDPAAAALTDSQMRLAESFEGFDFEKIWTMGSGTDYPYPRLDPQVSVTFTDQHEYGAEIAGTAIIVSAGTVLEHFPNPPFHEGCEFLGWDYDGAAIYRDTVIMAKYYDPGATVLNGYITFGPDNAEGAAGFTVIYMKTTGRITVFMSWTPKPTNLITPDMTPAAA